MSLFLSPKSRSTEKITTWCLPLPFSVKLFDSTLDSLSLLLSSVHISTQWCHPFLQQDIKSVSFLFKNVHSFLLPSYLQVHTTFGLFFYANIHQVYLLPGTSHVLFNNTSRDHLRQHYFVKTIINNRVKTFRPASIFKTTL